MSAATISAPHGQHGRNPEPTPTTTAASRFAPRLPSDSGMRTRPAPTIDRSKP